MFDFREDERLFFADTLRAVSKDQQGRDVLVGLTLEETEFYVASLRRRAETTPDDADIRRFFLLHSKHELHRDGVFGTFNGRLRGNAVDLAP